MSVEYSLHGVGTPPSTLRRTVASYEQELRRHRRTESGLREALAREETLLCQKDELIRHQAVLSQVRSSAVEWRANDRKPAFAARPGVGEC